MMNEDDKEKEIKSSPYNYNTQHNLADHSPRYTKKKKRRKEVVLQWMDDICYVNLSYLLVLKLKIDHNPH